MANLPNDYIELEYIESTGTQYIDTNFIPRYDTKVIVDIEPVEVSNWSALFGCRNQASPTASLAYLGACSSSTQLRSDYYGDSQVFDVETVITRFVANKNKNIFSALDKTLTNNASLSSSQLSMYLMALNDSGNSRYYIKAKIYSCKIYNNDIPIREFVPCKNKLGVVGLYDLVSNSFFQNNGTGQFIGGPAIIQKLPNDYIELEYIESTGTQYIDTGIAANENTEVYLDCQFTSMKSDQILMGSSAYIVFYLYGNVFYIQRGAATVTLTADNNKHTIIFTQNYTEFDGEKHEYIGQLGSSYNYFLFARNNNGAPGWYSDGRIYKCLITENSNTLRNFVPCKNSSGIIGLYDIIYATFYPNEGTGTFIAGPEVRKFNIFIKNTNWIQIVECYGKIDNIWKSITKIYEKINNSW